MRVSDAFTADVAAAVGIAESTVKATYRLIYACHEEVRE